MARKFSQDEIRATTRCIFGFIYAVVLALFVIVSGLLIATQARHREYEVLTGTMNRGLIVLASMEAELRRTPGNEVQAVSNFYLTSLRRTIETCEKQSESVLIAHGVREKLHRLADIPSSYSIVPVATGSYKGGQQAQYLASYQLLAGELTLETDRIQRTGWILLLLCCSFGALAIGSVPVANYFAHTRPLQQYASALLGYTTVPSEALTQCSYGIVRLFGGVVDVTVERQKKTEQVVHAVAEGNFDTAIDAGQDEYLQGISRMQQQLLHLSSDDRNNAWINGNMSRLESILKTDTSGPAWMDTVIGLLTKSVTAGAGALYSFEHSGEDEGLVCLATYGTRSERGKGLRIRSGEGQLGQLIMERKAIILNHVPQGYLTIKSGLGEAAPEQVVMIPLIFKDCLYGAVELGCFHPLREFELEWLDKASQSLAAHFFNQQVHEETRQKLQQLADKQAAELVEIHRLQQNTYTKLESKLREVEEEKAKNLAILEGCVDGVLSFDQQGFIHFCNHAAAEIWGAAPGTIREKTIFDLLDIQLRADGSVVKACLVTAAGEKQVEIRTEASVKSLQGDDVDVLLTSTSVRMQDNVYFTFFIQKISVDLF